MLCIIVIVFVVIRMMSTERDLGEWIGSPREASSSTSFHCMLVIHVYPSRTLMQRFLTFLISRWTLNSKLQHPSLISRDQYVQVGAHCND